MILGMLGIKVASLKIFFLEITFTKIFRSYSYGTHMGSAFDFLLGRQKIYEIATASTVRQSNNLAFGVIWALPISRIP